MPKHSNTDLSKFINDAMDYIGHSKEKISSRAAIYKCMAEKINYISGQLLGVYDVVRFELIFAGSRSEGVVQLLESDLDMMFVFRNFLCVDSGRIENDLTVLQTHMNESPPGYTKLIPLDMDSEMFGSAVLPLCTVYDLKEGHILLLSTCARNFFEGLLRFSENSPYAGFQCKIKQNSGPSVQCETDINIGGILSNILTNTLDADFVLAMPYLSSTILKTWKERSRKHEWPPHDVIDDISTMEGFVVPVGPKHSEEQNYGWRICFTTAEQKLVSHFSPIQSKLYALMKMIFKQIISPKCDLITSYMVKNIVFWVCEGNDAECFTRDKLIDLLLHSLAFLLQCLHSNFLPNYMIPSRNLLYGEGNHQNKIKLRRLLRELLKEGGAVVSRLRRLGTVTNVVIRHPMFGKSYGEWRGKVENLCLILGYILLRRLSPALFLQRSCVYDMLFEPWKDPLLLDVIFAMIKLFNFNCLRMLTDPLQCIQDFINLLKTLFS